MTELFQSQALAVPNPSQGPAFVAPHFITELGEEGLTLHECAQSLNATHQHVKGRADALAEKGAISPFNAIACIEVGFGRREVETYFLTTEDAKMLVASYDNAIGFGYRRYLIRCEKKADALTNLLANPRNAVAVFTKLAEVEEEKAALKRELEEERISWVNPTDLGKLLNMKAQEVNKRLEELGLQAKEKGKGEGKGKKKSKKWLLTEAGHQVAKCQDFATESYASRRILWDKDAVLEKFSTEVNQ